VRLVGPVREIAVQQASPFGPNIVRLQQYFAGQLVLEARAPVLDIGLGQGILGEEVEAIAVGRRRIAIGKRPGEVWQAYPGVRRQWSADKLGQVSYRV